MHCQINLIRIQKIVVRAGDVSIREVVLTKFESYLSRILQKEKKIFIFQNKFWWRRGNNHLQRAVNSTTNVLVLGIR